MVCGSPAAPLYKSVPDLLVGSPGRWTVLRCSSRRVRLAHLSPRPRDRCFRTHTRITSRMTRAANPAGKWTPQPGASCRSSSMTLGYPFGSDFDRMYCSDDCMDCHRSVASWPCANCSMCSHVPHGRLLEVGCGNGRQLERLAHAGWKVEGLDFDERAAQTARRLGLEVKVGDLASARYPDASFDAVILSHVIEHVPDPVALLVECRRILRSGGQLVLATPNSDSWGHRRFGRAWLGLDPPRHLLVFTPRALAEAAGRAGFSGAAIETKSIVGAWWFLASVWRRRALAEGGRAPLPNGREHRTLRLRAMALYERMIACDGTRGRRRGPSHRAQVDRGSWSEFAEAPDQRLPRAPVDHAQAQPARRDLDDMAEIHTDKRLEAVDPPQQRSGAPEEGVDRIAGSVVSVRWRVTDADGLRGASPMSLPISTLPHRCLPRAAAAMRVVSARWTSRGGTARSRAASPAPSGWCEAITPRTRCALHRFPVGTRRAARAGRPRCRASDIRSRSPRGGTCVPITNSRPSSRPQVKEPPAQRRRTAEEHGDDVARDVVVAQRRVHGNVAPAQKPDPD